MNDFREEEKLGKLYDTQLTHRLMRYLRPYAWNIALAVLLTLGVTAMEVVAPYLFHVAIDRNIIPGLNGQIAASTAKTGLIHVVLFYAGSIIAGFANHPVEDLKINDVFLHQVGGAMANGLITGRTSG